ncbi:hypothetical protein CQ020_03825 [Arthrobacter sp. MYb23]|uniref:BNR repeat-containing protein n=1 Tax=unclassified Arthrobacter TaxID=235627 RepID=UPI000CFBAA91|nr:MULTISPECIES: BNR repeat-containing protein [unclassified Arthrobacter]PRB44348.1 hypothetical protein CQ038_03680 [Arthrobacter sp. MYb51]PRB98600.1 hypothetical protein CQ020_03825 [Arthrobacter sp. MYb23]
MAYMKDAKGRRLDTFEVEAKAFTPPMAFSHLPGGLSGKSQYNGVSYNQDSISTGDGKQYAGWYNEAGALIIGKRKLPTGAWSTFDLSGVAGNPLVLPVDNDPHNNVSLIVDAQGYIHVAANMHGDVLRYVRSTNPHDITAWTAPGMTGLNEAQVTYPRWALHPDGTLFFMYRDGASGNGDIYLNRRNVGGAWTQLGMLAAGKATNENPYESRFVISAAGTLAVALTWRPNGGDANTNADVHFIKSTDKGATWKNAAGAAVTIPLVHSNTNAKALATAATNSGIINQFGLDLDVSDHPHIALMLASDAGPDRNIHHLWWNGTAWVNEQVTDLKNGMGITNWTTRPAIVCTAEGRTLIAYSVPRFGSLRGVPRLVDVTGGKSTEVPLVDVDLRDLEITFDGRAMRERNELYFMVSHANADVGNPGAEYWDVNNFSRQWGAIVSVDLSQIGVLLRREARVPRIRTIQTMSVPLTTVTSTTDVALPGSGGLITTPDLRGKQVFARLTGRASTTGGTCLLSVFEVQQGGTSRLFGSIPFTASTTVMRSTPWIPLQYGPTNNTEALLQILGRVSATFTGSVSTAVLELGVMDGPVY